MTNNLISLENLRYLAEAAKCKSISKAADKLFLSKSAVSLSIKNLEKEFGVPLLERTAKGVFLTPAGEKVVEKSRLIFDIINNMKYDCATDQCALNKTVHFYMNNGFASQNFPTFLAYFKNVADYKQITVHQANLSQMVNEISLDRSSFGFGFYSRDFAPDEFDDIVIEKLKEYELCLFMAKNADFIAPEVTEISIDELNNLPFVFMENSDSTADFDQTSYYNRNNVTFITDNSTVYQHAVLCGFGLGTTLNLKTPSAMEKINNFRLIKFKEKTTGYFYFIYNSKSDPGTVERFRRILIDSLNLSH